jgi:hypothetical protein
MLLPICKGSHISVAERDLYGGNSSPILIPRYVLAGDNIVSFSSFRRPIMYMNVTNA